MDHKGNKVWAFGCIPLAFNANNTEWAVDIEHPLLNSALNWLTVKLLDAYAERGLSVTLVDRSPRRMVKKQPAYNESGVNTLTRF